MTARLITAAPEEPVTLDAFKTHARIDGNDSDADALEKLLAARVHMEDELDRPLITSTWDLFFAAWPEHFELLGNTQSVTHLKWTDTAGAVHTVDPTTYKLVRAYDPTSGPSDARRGLLIPAYGQYWPTETLDVGEPIVIRVVAGWKDAASVPAPIVSHIELLAAHWYRNREAAVLGNSASAVSSALVLPPSVMPYRLWKF